jgi:hypothetical protein
MGTRAVTVAAQLLPWTNRCLAQGGSNCRSGRASTVSPNGVEALATPGQSGSVTGSGDGKGLLDGELGCVDAARSGFGRLRARRLPADASRIDGVTLMICDVLQPDGEPVWRLPR